MRYRANPFILFSDVVASTGSSTGSTPAFDSNRFNFYWEFSESLAGYVTSTFSGSTWFVSAPQLNTIYDGSADGNELYSNGITTTGSGNGWVVRTDRKGLELIGSSEIALRMRMHSASVENGQNLGANNTTGPDYVWGAIVSWNGTTGNDTLNKFNGHEFKWQGSDWKFNGPHNTALDGSGTVSNDAKINWPITRTNGALYCMCNMRNSQGRNFTNWVGPISPSSSWSNVVEGNTVSQSTADGTPLYLREQSALFGNNDNFIEIFMNERGAGVSGTIVHAMFWEKLPQTGSLSEIRTRIQQFYEYGQAKFGSLG